MAEETCVAIAAQYDSEDGAVADFDEIHAHYMEHDRHEHGPFDAAVITRGLDGKLRIVKRDDGGIGRGTRKGLVIGLAIGLALALLPAVTLGGALVVAGGCGAGIGAIAGHLARRTPSQNLEEIGATLDAGSAGIVVIVDPDAAAEVETLLARAIRTTWQPLAVGHNNWTTKWMAITNSHLGD